MYRWILAKKFGSVPPDQEVRVSSFSVVVLARVMRMFSMVRFVLVRLKVLFIVFMRESVGTTSRSQITLLMSTRAVCRLSGTILPSPRLLRRRQVLTMFRIST